MEQGVENGDVLSLAAGLVDPATLPTDTVVALVTNLSANEAEWRGALQYGTTAGSAHLREQLLKHFVRLEGGSRLSRSVRAEDLVVTAGSQQLLSLVTQALIDPGDICLVAAPTYFVYLGTLESAGARIVSVPSDQDGMLVDALERQLQEASQRGELSRVKLVYVVSYFENPTGMSLASSRRHELYHVVRRWSRDHPILILEDAAYRELQFEGESLSSLWSMDGDRRHVAITHTFSKSFSPGMRVGYGVFPDVIRKAVTDIKSHDDFGSPHLPQSLLACALANGMYDRHVSKLRASYRAKRDVMATALARELGDVESVRWWLPEGGLYFWLTLSEEMPTQFDSPLFRRAVDQHQVMFVPGSLFYTDNACDSTPGARPQHHLRLSFGVQDSAGIDEGVARLASAIKSLL